MTEIDALWLKIELEYRALLGRTLQETRIEPLSEAWSAAFTRTRRFPLDAPDAFFPESVPRWAEQHRSRIETLQHSLPEKHRPPFRQRLENIVDDVSALITKAIGGSARYQSSPPAEEVANRVRRMRGQAAHERSRAEARLQQFADTHGRIFVCSDIHLGVTKQQERNNFYQFLDLCQRDTLVLLGDVIDFWIDVEQAKDTELTKRVVTYWMHLYSKLVEIKERGARIVYVPGNHDPYIFLFEAVGQFPWAYEVLKRCPQLHEMYAQTSSHRFAALIEIAYPFLLLPLAGKQLLLTHGHAEDWFWRLLDPNQKGVRLDVSPGMLGFATQAATSFVHKHISGFAGNHLRSLRHWVAGKDSFVKLVQHSLDVGLVITNQVINAHRQGLRNYEANPGAFCDALDAAFQAYFNSPAGNDPNTVEDDIKRSLKRLDEIYSRPLDAIRRDTENYLQHAAALNYLIGPSDDRGVVHASAPVSDLRQFDQLIVGHFHEPREQSPTYDSGCFYEGISSGFQINRDGTILRPDW